MRILALDVGTKSIGVAVSDELRVAAHGVTTVKRTELKRDLDAIGRIIEHYNPSEVLIGVPYNSDGTVGKRGEAILEFAQKVKERFSLPLNLWDESFSTASAENILLEADLSRKKRRKVIDKVAAVIILQDYLKSRENVGPRTNTSEYE